MSSHSESEILNPGCILAEYNGAHDTRRHSAPSVPMRAPCVHVSLVTAGHNIVQGRRRGEDLVKPIIREALYQRQIKTQYGRKASYYRQPQSVSLSSEWWIANMRNLVLVLQCYKHWDGRDKDWGIKMSVPGTRIFWAALFNSPHSANWRTELNWDMGLDQ